MKFKQVNRDNIKWLLTRKDVFTIIGLELMISQIKFTHTDSEDDASSFSILCDGIPVVSITPSRTSFDANYFDAWDSCSKEFKDVISRKIPEILRSIDRQNVTSNFLEINK